MRVLLRPKTITKRMYVWQPDSLSDYTDGLLCVIAEEEAFAAFVIAQKWQLPEEAVLVIYFEHDPPSVYRPGRSVA
jgi:hypothetical protein